MRWTPPERTRISLFSLYFLPIQRSATLPPSFSLSLAWIFSLCCHDGTNGAMHVFFVGEGLYHRDSPKAGALWARPLANPTPHFLRPRANPNSVEEEASRVILQPSSRLGGHLWGIADLHWARQTRHRYARLDSAIRLRTSCRRKARRSRFRRRRRAWSGTVSLHSILQEAPPADAQGLRCRRRCLAFHFRLRWLLVRPLAASGEFYVFLRFFHFLWGNSICY